MRLLKAGDTRSQGLFHYIAFVPSVPSLAVRLPLDCGEFVGELVAGLRAVLGKRASPLIRGCLNRLSTLVNHSPVVVAGSRDLAAVTTALVVRVVPVVGRV